MADANKDKKILYTALVQEKQKRRIQELTKTAVLVDQFDCVGDMVLAGVELLHTEHTSQ